MSIGLIPFTLKPIHPTLDCLLSVTNDTVREMYVAEEVGVRSVSTTLSTPLHSAPGDRVGASKSFLRHPVGGCFDTPTGVWDVSRCFYNQGIRRPTKTLWGRGENN